MAFSNKNTKYNFETNSQGLLDNLLLQDEIAVLEDQQLEYPKIHGTIDRMFKSYYEKLNNLERVESEHMRENELLQEEIKSSLSFVDRGIDELQEKIKKLNKITKHIQIQNRLKLNKIIVQGPPESKELARNSKKFFELYVNVKIKNKVHKDCI